MKQIILFTCSFFIAINANAFDINSYCSQVSDAVGGSYQIEKACRGQEYEAIASINSMNTPSRIEKYCREVGQAVGGSYQIMKACIHQETQAKNGMY
ncbi:MAG: hypothetical protein HFP81_02340 [Methylococcales symbiont of Hymedesmia sp. n. MRB-2018]|nr:MAG: hypothetical protein HFP81_02340 [Methylococcales symbiont of Hymedesmia sp. n. MRB-2018]